MQRNRRGRMLPACRTAGDEFAIPTFDLTPRDVAGFTDELQEFQGLFHDCFPRSEPRAHFFDYPYNATFFSPPFLGVYDARDRPGDCAVGPTPQKRGSLQSSLYAGATRLGIAGAAATPLVLALFSPRRPCKCQRKKWASIVSNMWCCQPAYFRTS